MRRKGKRNSLIHFKFFDSFSISISFLFFVFLILIAWTSGTYAKEDVLTKQLALVKEGEKSIPELLAEYKEMMRLEPENPLGYVLAANVYFRDESKVLYEKAISISSNYAPACVGLARYFFKSGNAKKSLDEFKKAVSLMPKNKTLRKEAIYAAIKAQSIEDAKSIAGDDLDLKIEVLHALIDNGRLKIAKKNIKDFGFDSANSGTVLAVKGHIFYAKGKKQKDQDLIKQGVDLLLESWREDPKLSLHYKYNYPRKSLINILAKTQRKIEFRAVIEKGIKMYPREYSLYTELWKLEFADPKGDFVSERKALLTKIDILLKNHPASPDLFRVATLGYRMADAPERAERINQRLMAEFPYSLPAQMLWRREIGREKDAHKKLALMKKFLHDFPQVPSFYQTYFPTLDELNVPDPELLKAAEAFIQHQRYPFSVRAVGEVFLRRKIYLDRLEQWLSPYEKESPEAKINAGEARLLSLKAKLLLLRGRQKEAENILRRVLELELPGWGNVDKGKAKFYLGEILEAQNRLPEALDLYAQAYAQSQRYLKEAGENFQKIYRQMHDSEKGMEEYLAIREEIYQSLSKVGRGLERGTKIDKPAPDFELRNLAGDLISLSSLRGKVVILNFWATWCGPCNLELPHLQELYEKMKNDNGVAILTISTDENRALVDPFMRRKKFTFTVLYDERIRSKFEVRGVPTTFIIDPSGIIKLRMVGFNPNEPLVPYLEKLIEQYRIKQKGPEERECVNSKYHKKEVIN